MLKPAPAPASLDPEWERRRRLQVLFGVACFGSLASAIWMVFLAPNGYTTRAYYGTDCRAQALLVGAAISIGLTLWKDGSARRWFTRLASVLAVAGVAGTAALWATTAETTTFAFSGGFMVASLAAGAVVLGCAVAPRSLVVRLLELPPLPQWGRISYGVYLWYWPVLLVMTGQRLHWGVYPLFLARVGVTVAIAALSYDLVEMPVRRGALKRWRSWVAAPIGAALAISAVFISTLVPVGAAELQGSQLAVQTPVSTTTTTTTTQPAVPGRSTTTVPPTTTTTTPCRPTCRPPLPASTGKSNKPVKVLLVGDSIAGTLGVGLAEEARPYNVQIANEGTPGCSLSMQGQIKVLFYTVAPDAPCDVGKNPNSLFDTWRKWVDAYNPDVVVYLARGETFDQEVGGQWQNLGQAAFDTYLADRYRQAVSVLGSRGASVVLMATPYYDSGTSPAGTPWPEDAPARVTVDNATMRQVATSSTGAGTGRQGLRVRPQRRGLTGPRLLTHGGPDQRALHGRRAFHAIGRDLRRPPAGSGAGGAGAGPRRGVAGWRMAGSCATIDSAMVHQPALPVEPAAPSGGSGSWSWRRGRAAGVRRATAATSAPWPSKWRGPSSMIRSRPTSSATKPVAKRACGRTSAPR